MTTFNLKNPTTGFVGGYTSLELVERHMNDAAKHATGPIEELQAQLQALTQIVANLVDDLNPDRSNVLAITEAFDLEETTEELSESLA